MAEGEDSCYGDEELYEYSSLQPDDRSIATKSLFQASRLLEERIRNFDSGDDVYGDFFSLGDDLQLHSDDFNMSLLPADSQKLPLTSTVPSAAAEHSNQSGKAKPRPVPRPRLSKMLPRTAQPAAAADLLCAAAVTGGSSRRCGASDSGYAGSGENPQSDTKCVEPQRRAVADPWVAGGDFACLPDDLDSYAVAATQYRVQLEFAQKRGFSEAELRAALAIAGPEADSNRLLSALIQVHDADSTARADGCSGSDVSSPAAAFDLPASLQQLQLAATWREHTDSSSNSSKRSSAEVSARLHSDDVFQSSASASVGGEDDEDDLRAIVIDGSNVAMSHGNKQVFSCRGIQIVVNWFRQRGHKTITVFVPQWRKETSYPMAPISDQHVLDELEQEKVLAYTPSRRLHGRRVACYDDRYILQLATSEDAVVVSNDNYRDLAKESPAFKRVVEERLLMYTFVNDRFMPPDDPLGRHGPTLDQFLRRSLAKGSQLSTRGSGGGSGPRGFGSGQLCPYGRKCTYGVKCKYAHPERSAAAGGASAGVGRTALGSALAVAARPSGSPAHAVAEGASLANYSPDQSRTRSPVMRSMSSNYAGTHASSASVVWSLGASAPEDENRTHSLPADCSAAAFVSAVGNSLVSSRAAAAVSRRLRTDTDVLNECEQRLAAVRNVPTAALQMQAAAAAVRRPPGTRWRRSLPQDSTVNSESHVLGATPATSGGYGWHGGAPRQYEDPRDADAAAARFMATAYDFDSAPGNSSSASVGVSGGSGSRSSIAGNSFMQNLLHRQHSYSDPHLSGSGSGGGFYSSSGGSDCGGQAGQTASSGSPYNSSGELVARTSWPYCTDDQQQQHSASPISTLYASSAQQLLPRGAARPVRAYQEVIPAAAQPWSYFGDAYPPPHLLLPGSGGNSSGRQFAAAVLSYGGGQPAGYGFVSGASVGVSSSSNSMGNGHASGTFVDAFAQQPARVLLTRNAATPSVQSMPVEGEDAHALTGSGAGVYSSAGFGQY